MHILKALSLLLLPNIVFGASYAAAQANIVENQTTYIYVDANAGSDSNSGAQSAPFKTIQAAINKANWYNQQSIGVKVIIDAGIYREAVSITNSKSTSASLTVQAAVAGTAILAGSNVVTGWNQQNSTTWQAPFSDTRGFCALPSGWPSGYAPIIERTEMVFVNGVPLTQVLAFNDMKPGTFYFSDAYQLLHIAPPSGTNMSTAVVEVAARPSVFTVSSRSNVVLRGLVFRHAANCFNTAAVTINNGSNILVDSVQALWNNWAGIAINATSSLTVQNSIFSYNGGAGLLGTKNTWSLYSFDETDYNNWRGAQGAFYDWAMGGAKLFQNHNATVQSHFSYNNQAEGLWFDTDNQNITVNNATLVGSTVAALQIERDLGPITVENSRFCSSGQGINVLTSPSLTIKNNTFYNNSGTNKYQAELYLAGQAGGIVINDFATGVAHDLFTSGMVLTGNTFVDASSGQLLFGTYLSGSDWTEFASSLNAGNNIWYDPTTANSFKVVNGKIVNLSDWQSTVQTDYSSQWKAPATSPVAGCTPPKPTFADFNVNLDSNSYTMSAAKAVATAHVNSFGYGTVNLQLEGLPSGVTATMSQSSLLSGAVTITFSASSTATRQTVPITLWAVSGSRVHNVTFYLKLSAS